MTTWQKEFKNNHEKLQEFDYSEQPYATENTYENAMKAYNDHWNALQDGLAAFHDDSDEDALDSDIEDDENNVSGHKRDGLLTITDENSSSGNTTEQDSGEIMLKVVYNDLVEIVTIIKTIERDATLGYLRAQMEIAKDTFNTFKQTYVMEAAKKNAICDRIDFRAVQNSYALAIGKLNDIIQGASDSKKIDKVQIPKAKIPEFDGKITAWKAFRECFGAQ